ncbi:MAG: formylmethanofuran--tetrahydromethanopterin N-formyltransferase [Gammaproteobacteria bacterium]|nr:formylmethanofuran--tetrahydromethanopterin N-formyltransferase [Gammaproteobacteria bacterium]
MRIKTTEVIDTFAEAFEMWASRIIITAQTAEWALAAARSMTGFATSVIGCKCEAGVETRLDPAQTPDRRPGVSVLLFAFDAQGVGKRLTERIGQCVMTTPTTACYNGLTAEQTVAVGGQLRYFGDGFQTSKKLGDRRFWRIPVMDGEFVIDEQFGVVPAVGGGNLLILGKSATSALQAAKAATKVMRSIPGVILPFPDGLVRSGSKVGSKYKSLPASTNDAFCPTLRAVVERSQLPEDVNCVLEIVIDGLSLSAVEEAMRQGVQAAARRGIKQISAGNYGGNLGKYHIRLHALFEHARAVS